MSKKIITYFKKNLFIFCLVPPTFIGIIVSSIVYKINFLTIMPLFVSLLIMILQSEANRYAFLIGSFNSLFYAVIDFSFTLYSSAANALLLSFPVQLITFIRWNKRAYKGSTKFTKLSPFGRIIMAGISVVVFIILNMVFNPLGSSYMMIDNIVFVISTLTYILTLFSFIEYPILSILGNIISLGMNFAVFADNPTRLPYILYSVYSLICVTKGAVSVFRLYREQQNTVQQKSKYRIIT